MFEISTYSKSAKLPPNVSRKTIQCTLIPPEMLSERITPRAPEARRIEPSEDIIAMSAFCATPEERHELRQGEWYYLRDIHNVASPTKESYACFRTKPDGAIVHSFIPLGLEMLSTYTVTDNGHNGHNGHNSGFRLTLDVKQRSSVMFTNYARMRIEQQWDALIHRMIEKSRR